MRDRVPRDEPREVRRVGMHQRIRVEEDRPVIRPRLGAFVDLELLVADRPTGEPTLVDDDQVDLLDLEGALVDGLDGSEGDGSAGQADCP
jgi:hypothetical protein